MRVLVIDDSRSSATVIAQRVEAIAGVTATVCLDPQVALAQCAETEFDLVLVDYVMPKLDGIEVLTALRALERYRLVPMIMIASTLDVEVKRRAIQAGATDFLSKPCDWIEFQARVRNLLTLRQAQIDLGDRARKLTADVASATARRGIMFRGSPRSAGSWPKSSGWGPRERAFSISRRLSTISARSASAMRSCKSPAA